MTLGRPLKNLPPYHEIVVSTRLFLFRVLVSRWNFLSVSVGRFRKQLASLLAGKGRADSVLEKRGEHLQNQIAIRSFRCCVSRHRDLSTQGRKCVLDVPSRFFGRFEVQDWVMFGKCQPVEIGNEAIDVSKESFKYIPLLRYTILSIAVVLERYLMW